MTNHAQGRQFSFERLTAWQLALEVVTLVEGIAGGIGRPHGELVDQVRRASLSIVCNLAEGVGKDGKDQLRFIRIARGSTYETAALIEVAFRLRLVSELEHARIREVLLSVAALLTRLLLPRPA